MATLIRWTRIPLTLLVAFLVLAAGVGAAHAVQERAGNGGDQRGNAALERMLQETRQRLARQEQRLNWANDHAAQLDTTIAKLKEKGKNTAALEQAVATFRGRIGEARRQSQAAAGILANPAGFDAQGKVTNPIQARETLKQARSAMEQASKTAGSAYRDLRAAVEAFRKANREMRAPAEPEKP